MLKETTEIMWTGTIDEIVEKVKELQLGIPSSRNDSELAYNGVRKQLENLVAVYSYVSYNNEDAKKLPTIGKIFYLEFSKPFLKDNNDVPEVNFNLTSKLVCIVQ